MKLTPKQLRSLRQAGPSATGNRVALAIELSGETQKVVCEATGFSQPYLSNVARGQFDDITVENGRKLAAHFGCSIEDLFPAREQVAS
jgi:transcriptional regulator with XRE-family HTH domain